MAVFEIFKMSSYLDGPDTDSDNEVTCTLNEEEIAAVRAQCAEFKDQGNECFQASNLEGALEKYTVYPIINTLACNIIYRLFVYRPSLTC